MAVFDLVYNDHLHKILSDKYGSYTYEDPNRKGVFRTELASATLRHDLSDGFPILTTKKTFFKGAVAELLFFLSGSTDIRDLWRRKVNFWDKDWARFHGYDEASIRFWKGKVDEMDKHVHPIDQEVPYSMGRIYPAQYRAWTGVAPKTGRVKQVDQFANVVRTLWKNPMSTSMIVNAWNPAEINDMALPPCHYGFQIVGRPLSLDEREAMFNRNIGWIKEDTYRMESLEKEFDKHNIPRYGFEIHWQQRSTDYFLGTPINVQYYALLAYLLQQITGHKALAIQGDLKNVHLYDNQIKQGVELLTRNVWKYENSNLILSNYLVRVKEESHFDGDNLDEILEGLTLDDFKLDAYDHYPRLSAEMLSRDN